MLAISWLDRRIEGGFGIMLDDVMAALFAVILMIEIFAAMAGPCFVPFASENAAISFVS